MLSEEDKFKEYLLSKKLKFTPERQAILDRIFANHKHFEADELLVDLRNNNLKISKATHEHHDHLVCNKCGKIIEFIEHRIEKLQDEVCKSKKFKPESHRLQIQGLCEDCNKIENAAER